MIRRIVIPVRGDGKGDNVLAHAAALARRHEAHVYITHCRARPEDMMPYGVVIPNSMRKLVIEQTQVVANQVEDGMRGEVESLAQKFQLKLTEDRSIRGASASWVEEAGRQVDVIKRHGRIADLICVAQPDLDRNLGSNTLRAALFNTGRPVMMCPNRESPPEDLGNKIAIAWNGSIEASRAVGMNMELIKAASEVTILSGGNEAYGSDADSLAEHLKDIGVYTKVIRFNAENSVGAELLQQAESIGADCMIMGAYGDSREREIVFGGNTQHLVDHSTLPIVFVQ